MAAKFELKKAANGQLMFNLKAGNGEVILTSETYVAKAAAKDGIAAVRVNAPLDARYDRRIATNGQRYFVLKTPLERFLSRSQAGAFGSPLPGLRVRPRAQLHQPAHSSPRWGCLTLDGWPAARVGLTSAGGRSPHQRPPC